MNGPGSAQCPRPHPGGERRWTTHRRTCGRADDGLLASRAQDALASWAQADSIHLSLHFIQFPPEKKKEKENSGTLLDRLQSRSAIRLRPMRLDSCRSVALDWSLAG